MKLNKLYLHNFKSFNDSVINFNPDTTILIGDNGVGKSTIIQALRLLLKGSSFEFNGVSYLSKLINSKSINDISEGKLTITKLPRFDLALTFEFDADHDNLMNRRFCGETRIGNKVIKGNGIIFSYHFNMDYKDDYNQFVQSHPKVSEIPFDLYTVDHNTFGGNHYSFRMDPFKSIFVNNDQYIGNPYNDFARQIYGNLSASDKHRARLNYRHEANLVFENITSANDYDLTIDPDKLKFESLLGVSSKDGVFLEEEGSGKENLIKTKLALNSKSNSKLVIIEEPENHLTAYNTRKQLSAINPLSNTRQLIVTTHDSHIVSRLSWKKTIWIRNSSHNRTRMNTFGKISDNSISFFNRRDDLDFLRIITASKIILVEGAAEYLLMPTFIWKVSGNKNNDGIEVISMGGKFYQPFKELGDNLTDGRLYNLS